MAAACPGMEHHLTSTKAMQRRLKRTKAKGVNMAKELKTINKIVKTIPDILTKTTDGGVFMRFCGYVDNSDTNASNFLKMFSAVCYIDPDDIDDFMGSISLLYFALACESCL